ncbi:Protein of unknown function [Propionibacterium freudenreichii]|nr:Protein of unknown function [Propionibacterium freudenreichii]
MQSTGTVGIDA